MSQNAHETFLKDSTEKAFDLKHRKTIQFNMGRYQNAVNAGMAQFEDHELGRQRASYLKQQVVENLDKYLVEFENNFTANGGKVIWARDGKEACSEILKIFKAHKAKQVVKSKTMTSEEIHLNEFLEGNGIETIETDLGEFIVQLNDEKPYHIVTPAMHLSRQDIGKIFEKHLHIPYTEDPNALTLTARKLLRQKYLDAEIGISGGNFLVADIGGVAVTENEGNARLSTTFPKVHIAIVGIEKIIPSMEDLALFWPMLAQSGTGQRVTVYNSIFTGPRKETETDGPTEMYVVLLDNGRSDLLADPEKRQALHCIRCGACLNACPVYKNIGGHTYTTTYSGPIGSILSPHYNGMQDFKHLSYASSLCGACTSVCPVKIDIHNLLLLNRKESVDKGFVSGIEKKGFGFWRVAMKNRRLMDLVGPSLKNFFIKTFFTKAWGNKRRLPEFKTSFSSSWTKSKMNK